jgi:streptogramin lyase
MARLVAAVVAFGLAVGPGAGAARSHGALILVDPSTDATVATVQLSGEPLRVTYGAGAFWVVAPAAARVFRVDARTRAVEPFRVGREPFGAAVGGRALWIADHDGFRVLRVDLATGRVSRTRDLGSPQLALAYGRGYVWVIGADESLRRLDPRTLTVTATIPNVAKSVEGIEPSVAVGRGGIWVSDAVTRGVIRVNPRSLHVTRRWVVGGYGVAVGAPGVWSADGFSEVRRLEPGATGVGVRGNPVDVAVDGHGVWAAVRFGRALVRIDPQAHRVAARIPLGREAVSVATGGNLVAVAVD